MFVWLDIFFVYLDNVIFYFDGVLYLRVVDFFKVGRCKFFFYIKGESFYRIELIDFLVGN